MDRPNLISFQMLAMIIFLSLIYASNRVAIAGRNLEEDLYDPALYPKIVVLSPDTVLTFTKQEIEARRSRPPLSAVQETHVPEILPDPGREIRSPVSPRDVPDISFSGSPTVPHDPNLLAKPETESKVPLPAVQETSIPELLPEPGREIRSPVPSGDVLDFSFPESPTTPRDIQVLPQPYWDGSSNLSE